MSTEPSQSTAKSNDSLVVLALVVGLVVLQPFLSSRPSTGS